MNDQLDINGDPPDLKGQTLQELLVQSYWVNDKIVEEASLVFLKTNGVWYSLYFDCGIIFWRPKTKSPEAYDYRNDEDTLSEFRIEDLGRKCDLIGKQIHDYKMEPVDGGSKVEFRLKDETCIGFENINDNTKIITQQKNPRYGVNAARDF
jgi:hypothetical protein